MAFTPRLTSDGMRDNPWWYSNENPFYVSGYGLPNCTCYAYGRYAEIKGSFAKLPTGNAGDWWGRAQNAFDTGQTPQLGAIACWRGPEGSGYSGHVAVVEQIYPSGDFLTSNSGYTRNPDNMESQYFFTYYCDKSSGYLGSGWMKRRNYSFQGFIYQGTEKTLPSGSWSAKNSGGYARTSDAALGNAINVCKQMTEYGWSLNAICGLLGNIEQECSYNFWLWENGRISSTSSAQNSSRNNGYGFVQWTPASTYTKDSRTMTRDGFGPNYTDVAGKLTDAEVQLWAIQNCTDGEQWYPVKKRGFTLTWEQYKTSEADPQWLAEAFMREYERPAEATNNLSRRKAAAQYWYDYFSGFDPPSRPTDEPDPEPPPYSDEPSPAKPVVTPKNQLEKIDAKWYAKPTGYYERQSDEAYSNACCVFNRLWFDEKWSVKSVCAVLGWMECFSDYNPFRWSGDDIQPSFHITGSPETGYYETPNVYLNEDWCMYGLIQFSPANSYFDNSASCAQYAPNFRNPVWYQTRNPESGTYTLHITDYVNTGAAFDGDAQLNHFMETLETVWTNPPDGPYQRVTLKSFLSRRSVHKIPWMIRVAAQCLFALDADDYRMEQATQAARHWYSVFRKYEPEKTRWPVLYSGKHYLIRNGE